MPTPTLLGGMGPRTHCSEHGLRATFGGSLATIPMERPLAATQTSRTSNVERPTPNVEWGSRGATLRSVDQRTATLRRRGRSGSSGKCVLPTVPLLSARPSLSLWSRVHRPLVSPLGALSPSSASSARGGFPRVAPWLARPPSTANAHRPPTRPMPSWGLALPGGGTRGR